MAKPVTFAQLHDGFFLPGVAVGGQFAATLPPTNKTLKNFKMTLQDDGTLFVEWEEGNYIKNVTIAAANYKVLLHPSVPIKSTSKKD